VLIDFDFDYLFLWGHYRLLMQMHNQLHERIQDSLLKLIHLRNLGMAYKYTGQTSDSIRHYEKALKISIEIHNRLAESAILNSLGNSYGALGDTRKAIEFYEQGLVIAREIGDRNGEQTYLGNIGIREFELGNSEKSLVYLEKALAITREIGDKVGECLHFGNIGEALVDLRKYEEAIKHHKQAQDLAKGIEYVGVLQYNIKGESQAYLFQNDLVNARVTIEAALQYDVPENNHNVTALHGIIALRQGEREIAKEAFNKSIAQAGEILATTPDFYDALDAKGLTLCGRAVCGEWKMENGGRMRDEIVAEAMETFRKARKIAPHAGVVKFVLRLFDELVKCDEEGILKDVRKAAEGVE